MIELEVRVQLVWRGYEARPEGLEVLVIGAPNLGVSPREDVEHQRDWVG